MTTTGTTYEDLLKNALSLNADEIEHLKSAGIGDIMGWKTLNEDDVTNMVAQIRKEKWEKTPGATPVYKTFRVVQERNVKTLWSEVRIHYELNIGIKAILDGTPNSDSLMAWEARRKEREAFADPPSDQRPLSAMISRNWVKGFEVLDEWISSHIEDSYKIPLSVMIRPAAANKWNDTWRTENLHSQYSTFCPRVTWRTLPSGEKMKVTKEWVPAGSVKLWQILFAIFQDHPAYSHIKGFRKRKDGIGAYNSLRQHYLGKNAVNNMATELEAEFNNLSYNGETRRWNFEKYVTKHVELYNRVQELEAHGYSGMDAQSRVRKFMSGIKTAKLDVVKTSVLADPKLQSDFDRVSNLYKDYICQDKSLNSSKRDAANIAGLQGGQSTGNNRNGRNGRNQNQGNGSDNRRNSNGRNVSDVSVQDRYYTKEEYAKLSADEKSALYRMRKRRKTDGGGSNNGGNQNLNANVSAFVTAMATQLSAMNQNGQDNDSGEQQAPEDSNGATEGGNRNHPALRQSTRGRN